MFYMQFMGGLGNQMFQYAAAISLSSTRSVFFKSYFEDCSDAKREFELSAFNLEIMHANEMEIKKIHLIKNNLSSDNTPGVEGPIRPFIEKADYIYDDEFQSIPDHTLIIGYWQNEQYFSKYRAHILNLFTLKHPISEFNQTVLRLIQAQHTSVSIHIRRADYVINPKVFEKHGVCTMAYYNTAINYLKTLFTLPFFFIFSDDIDWVKAYFPIPLNSHLISSNHLKPYEDLFLMTKCKHQIIANSSYSWWGAWLNTNPEKIVIAPNEWLKGQFALPIICKDWIVF